MTMTNSTSEREQRLKEIRERLTAHRAEVDKYRSLQWAEGDALRYYQAPDDVDFLLSLLDGEATDSVNVSVLTGYEVGRKDGADDMRDLIVETIRALKNGHTVDPVSGTLVADTDGPWFLKSEVASAIESVTLEQEQK